MCWRRRDRVGGRESNACADGTIKISPISLCSHPNFCQNFNREVRHSLTWHSSESESALERFEPVAAAMLWSDGSLAMFAPEGDGCLNRARREDAGRIHKAGTTLCDFWYFWSCKSTIKEKLLKIKSKNPSPVNNQNKRLNPARFFFCRIRRKIKSYQKENAEIEVSRSAERDRRHRRLVPPFEKGGRKLYYGA